MLQQNIVKTEEIFIETVGDNKVIKNETKKFSLNSSDTKNDSNKEIPNFSITGSVE